MISVNHECGIKAVFYNLPNGSVKLEQWLDDRTNNINEPRNQWHKVLEYSDEGDTPNI
jgi:hypothetical protein